MDRSLQTPITICDPFQNTCSVLSILASVWHFSPNLGICAILSVCGDFSKDHSDWTHWRSYRGHLQLKWSIILVGRLLWRGKQEWSLIIGSRRCLKWSLTSLSFILTTLGPLLYIKRNLTATPTITEDEWKRQITPTSQWSAKSTLLHPLPIKTRESHAVFCHAIERGQHQQCCEWTGWGLFAAIIIEDKTI